MLFVKRMWSHVCRPGAHLPRQQWQLRHSCPQWDFVDTQTSKGEKCSAGWKLVYAQGYITLGWEFTDSTLSEQMPWKEAPCTGAHAQMHTHLCVEVRGQFAGVSPLLSLCGPQRSNWGLSSFTHWFISQNPKKKFLKSTWERTTVVRGSNNGEATQPIHMGAESILIQAHRIGFHHTTNQAGVRNHFPGLCFWGRVSCSPG